VTGATSQARALIESAGLVPRPRAATFRVVGDDGLDYLHRMTTQDVASLPPGGVTYACLLTPRGRILGDLLIWRTGRGLFIECDRAAVEHVLPVLEKFVITDDVAFEDATADAVRLCLAGPEAATELATAGFEVPAPGTGTEVEVGGGPAWLMRLDRGTLAVFEVRVRSDAVDVLTQRLTAGGVVVVCEPEAYDLARVHYGVPAYGTELGEEVLFNEAGLEHAVSWNKGCYPGQEPVVMARHRGRPPRRLCVLAIEGEVPGPGATLRDAEAKRPVGAVTSAAPALAGRPPAALGYVREKWAARGRALEVEGGGRATIVA
jgi:folate-binding protein YgfZ